MIIENVNDLVTRAHAVFVEAGYTEKSMKVKLDIAKAIIRLHDEQGVSNWSEDIVSNYIKNKQISFQNGNISRSRLTQIMLTADYLAQITYTGAFIKERHTYLLKLPDAFNRILSDIRNCEAWNQKARQHLCDHAGTFFRWLCSHEYRDMSHVDEHVVRDYLTERSKRTAPISLDNTRRALKKLFVFISEGGVLPETMNKLFLFRIPIELKVKPFMPQDEIAATLNVIDRSTSIGKRDYAIILLAAITGLRRVDIVELSLDSFDWKNGEIRIIQEKTGKALALPLTTDAGIAIRDYITNARPCNKSGKVFLNTVIPFSKMSPSNLTVILKKYCVKAELTKQWGFHSLRRSLATNMIASGTSVVTVAQQLGDANIDSTKPYISYDRKNLKECALDFGGIQIGGAAL